MHTALALQLVQIMLSIAEFWQVICQKQNVTTIVDRVETYLFHKIVR